EIAGSASGERSNPRPSKKDPGGVPGGESRDSAEERQAKELYETAEKYERSDPAEYEQRAARWREVVTKFPTTGWARKADEKHQATTASLQAFLDREFESTRKDAQALAAAGHFLDALEAIQAFRSAQSRDLLQRRADVEIEVLQNGARLAFNETVVKAKEMAARQDFSSAIALFESLAE